MYLYEHMKCTWTICWDAPPQQSPPGLLGEGAPPTYHLQLVQQYICGCKVSLNKKQLHHIRLERLIDSLWFQ